MFWFRNLFQPHKKNLQNLSALVIFNFLAAALFFITQIKIANVIGSAQFGLLAYCIAVGMYAEVIIGYGTYRTLVRELIHYPDRQAVLVMSSLIMRCLLLVVVVTVLLLLNIIFQTNSIRWVLICVVLAYALKALNLQPLYDVWNQMVRHSIYCMTQKALYFLLIWIIVFFATDCLNLNIVVTILLITEGVYLFLQQRWAIQKIDFRETKAYYLAVTIKEMLKKDSWIALTAVFTLSFGTLNQIILKHYAGLVELGIYAAPWQIVLGAILLVSQVSRIGNPGIARITRPEINGTQRKKFLIKYSCIMAASASTVFVPAILFPDLIITTIFSHEYASASSILRVHGIYIMVFSLGLVASQYVVSVYMERFYFISVIIGGLLSIILCYVLIPLYGGFGAAISLLLSHGFTMGLYWIAMIKHVKNVD